MLRTYVIRIRKKEGTITVRLNSLMSKLLKKILSTAKLKSEVELVIKKESDEEPPPSPSFNWPPFITPNLNSYSELFCYSTGSPDDRIAGEVIV
nr:hypothetical protein Iba_chr02eCG8180 [Ipomoea batatas]